MCGRHSARRLTKCPTKERNSLLVQISSHDRRINPCVFACVHACMSACLHTFLSIPAHTIEKSMRVHIHLNFAPKYVKQDNKNAASRSVSHTMEQSHQRSKTDMQNSADQPRNPTLFEAYSHNRTVLQLVTVQVPVNLRTCSPASTTPKQEYSHILGIVACRHTAEALNTD